MTTQRLLHLLRTPLRTALVFSMVANLALLAPSLMKLMGRWNWWLPAGPARLLRVRPSPLPEAAEPAGDAEATA